MNSKLIEELADELLLEEVHKQVLKLRESCPDMTVSDPYKMGDSINITMSINAPVLKAQMTVKV